MTTAAMPVAHVGSLACAHFCMCVGVCAGVLLEGPKAGVQSCPCTGNSSLGLGTTCEAWDLGVGHCARSSPPSWCNKEWCHIDPTNCDRPHRPSGSFQGMHYSYATCGFLDTHSPVSTKLNGQTLRVSFPGKVQNGSFVSSNGWGLVIHSDGKKQGATWEFVKTLFDEHNVTYTEVLPESTASLSQMDEFTACAHDVGLNATDLCVGFITETTDRLKMSTFSSEVTTDVYYLVALVAGQESWFEMLKKPFRPFEAKVWMMIIIVGVVIAIVYFIVEGDDMQGGLVERLQQSFYETFFSLLAGGVNATAEINTHSGRILQLGFAFFILLVISTYTAELTNYLITKDYAGQIESLEEAIEARYRICIPAFIKPTMERSNPRVANLLVESFGTLVHQLDLMDAGRCDAAIITLGVLDSAYSGVYTEDDRHCNKIPVGQPVLTSGISLPVREELQVAFSWAVVEQLEKGRWAVAERRAQDKFVPPTLCATATGGKMSESSGLSLKEMSGVFIVTALAVLLSFVCYSLEKCINLPCCPASKTSRKSKLERTSKLEEQDSLFLF